MSFRRCNLQLRVSRKQGKKGASREANLMRRQLDSDALLGIFGIIVYGVGAYFLIGTFFPGVFEFGHDALEWLGGLVPTSRGVAEAVWRTLLALMGMAVLTGLFFSAGLAGRQRPSGIHGAMGVLTGFTLLVIVAAYLYSIGMKFIFALGAGIIASLLIKTFFAYYRIRFAGGRTDRPPATLVVYRRVVQRGRESQDGGAPW